jgi:hypothetical protein
MEDVGINLVKGEEGVEVERWLAEGDACYGMRGTHSPPANDRWSWAPRISTLVC